MANETLKGALAATKETPNKMDTIRDLLKRQMPALQQALPKHMTAERMMRIALTTVRTTPKLLECDPYSLLGALMEAAQLGLEPGVLGQCYLVPFKDGRTGKFLVQFIIGYRGMIYLARNSGNIKSLAVHEVYENDYIEVVYGLEEKLNHTPWFARKDKPIDSHGSIIGAYAVAHFVDGGYQIHYMPKAEIDAHRARSKAADKGPWVSDETEMMKKTVVRSAWKWWPISSERMSAVEQRDETIVQTVGDDGVIDVTAGFVDAEEEARQVEFEEVSNDADKGPFKA